MLTRNARLAVIVVALLLLAWTIYQQAYQISAVVVLLTIMLVWSYFRQGTVVLASKAYHNKDYDKAERLLKEIANPDRLSKNRRGFYEFIYGNIELKRNNTAEAEKHFQVASRFPLRNENDKGIVLVQLANISLARHDYDRARAYIEKAGTLKISLRVQDIIKKIEKELPKTG